VVDYAALQRQAERDGRKCVVGALIHDGVGNVFVLRRSLDTALFAGCWDIVGGHVEAGEGLLDALGREITEETGWTLHHIRALVGINDWAPAADEGTPGADHGWRREFDFLVDVSGDLNHPRLAKGEHIEFRWIGPESVHVLDEDVDKDPALGLVRRAVRRALELVT